MFVQTFLFLLSSRVLEICHAENVISAQLQELLSQGLMTRVGFVFVPVQIKAELISSSGEG